MTPFLWLRLSIDLRRHHISSTIVYSCEQRRPFTVDLILDIDCCLDVNSIHKFSYCSYHAVLVSLKPLDVLLKLFTEVINLLESGLSINSHSVTSCQFAIKPRQILVEL